MTIRYPSKVKIDHKNILSSGVDTLVLTLDIEWQDTLLFSYLDELKEKAKNCDGDYPGELKYIASPSVWPFLIKAYGAKGYSWILSATDFTFKVGNWKEPGPRPSVIIEIRSETLWHLGAITAINTALGIIEANGGHICKARVSRVDLCVDVLMPEGWWNIKLLEYAVTRATDYAPYYRHKKLTGIRIGKGVVSVRLYDKPLEIAQQSKKTWMYDIWQVSEVPEGQKIIRVEFQIRREALKEQGIDTPFDLIEKAVNLWAYCTQNWLKFQDRPGLHHTQRSTFGWWEAIQNGFADVQGAEPLVREKAVCNDKKRLMQQINGLAISLHAIKQEEDGAAPDTPSSMQDCVVSYAKELTKNPGRLPDVKSRLKQKRSKYHREKISREDRVHKIARVVSNG